MISFIDFISGKAKSGKTDEEIVEMIKEYWE